MAQLAVRCADAVGPGDGRIPLAMEALCGTQSEPEVALRVSSSSVCPRLLLSKHLPESQTTFDSPKSSAQLLTGGTGGLGLLAAQWLARRGSSMHLVLVSRSGVVPEDAAAQLPCGRVMVRSCDVGELVDMLSLAATMQQALPPIRGTWHTAGVLADALLGRQNARTVQRAYVAKVGGASHLHRAHVAVPLDSSALFSSIAGIIGGAAQANYASANAVLDALSSSRRAQGCVAVSVAWGPWADVGMASGAAVNSRLGAMGLGLIDPWQGLAALETAVLPVRPAILAFWLVRWDVMLGQDRQAPALLQKLAPRSPPVSRVPAAQLKRSAPVQLDTIVDMARRTAGTIVDADTPLLEAGLDSLGETELRNLLQQAIGGDSLLPSSLLVDHPTARGLTALLEREMHTVLSQYGTMEAAPTGMVVGLDEVLEMVRRTAGSDVIDTDTPLIEMGLDSLGAVELHNQLQQAIGEDVELPTTLVDDHPTARQLAAFLAPWQAACATYHVEHVVSIPPAPSPLNLGALGLRLGSAFEASEGNLAMVLLRPPKAEGAVRSPPLVIMHSFLGDESGYERLWKLSLADRAIFAIRHLFLTHNDADTNQMRPAAEMLRDYTAALLAEFQTAPFDLIGASYGSLVAHHLAHSARIAGCCPRRLVLIDPFPFWPAIRQTAPLSALLASGGPTAERDPHAAAHFILKLRLYAQHGPERGEEMLTKLSKEMAAVPADAAGLFLAAQTLPADASREDLLVQALREHRRIMAVASVGSTITDLVEGMPPAHPTGGDPAVLMVLGSERMAFYEYVYGTTGFEDRLDLYGAALEPIRVEGGHFDVVSRCISSRVPEFTHALEAFLSADYDENSDGEFVSADEEDEGTSAAAAAAAAAAVSAAAAAADAADAWTSRE